MSGRRLSQPDTDADRTLAEALASPTPASFTMIAGAGAGKTTSLVKALARTLDAHGPSLLARGQQIACITYTVVAAEEIHADVEKNELVHVSTIHSFLWMIIKPFERDIHKWVIEKLKADIAELIAKREEFTPRTRPETRAKNEEDARRREQQLKAAKTITSWSYSTGADYARGVIGHEDVLKMTTQTVLAKPLLAKIVASRFPFIFVDESQDTMREVVDCLKHIQSVANGALCVGFFGDPMQAIFMRGVRHIDVDASWLKLTKQENYRSSARVLALVNNIRAADDEVQQILGNPAVQVEGHADLFVLPADEDRTAHLDVVRAWLDKRDGDRTWTDDDPLTGAKLLVMMHEMAADRLGFGELHTAFRTKGVPSEMRDAFEDGSAWPLTPILKLVMPAVDAFNGGRSLVPLLRTFSPALSDAAIGTGDPRPALQRAATVVASLAELVRDGGPGSIGQVLTAAGSSGLAELDPRLSSYLNVDASSAAAVLSESETVLLDAVTQCDVRQLPSYIRYVERQSPYSTHHGTKGTEYPRVLVVIDDEASKKFPGYSYGKLLGLAPLSDTDRKNQEQGVETVIERTRRLLYVCCSRAIESVAVVVFANNVEVAVEALAGTNIFATGPRTLVDLLTEAGVP